MPGRAHVVRAGTECESRLGGNEKGFTWHVPDCSTEDFLRKTLRIYIRSVKEIDTCFEANFDKTSGFLNIGIAPRPKKLVSSTEGSGAKAENRNLQATLSQ